MDESIFDEIGSFLKAESGRGREERLLDSGILLALLVIRGVTTDTHAIEIRAQEQDARRLFSYLVEPGLAPELATVEEKDKGGLLSSPSWIIRPNWERIADFYGKDVQEFDVILRERFPGVIRRHRLTIAYLLSGD